LGARPWASAPALFGELQTRELRAVGRGQRFEEAAPEQAREHPYRQEEARSARHPAIGIQGEAAAGHDAAYMRMVSATPGWLSLALASPSQKDMASGDSA
jgi:hypothetical protein